MTTPSVNSEGADGNDLSQAEAMTIKSARIILPPRCPMRNAASRLSAKFRWVWSFIERVLPALTVSHVDPIHSDQKVLGRFMPPGGWACDKGWVVGPRWGR